MIDDKEFLAFINDKSLDGSLEENLSRIIDEELEKSEEEMDAELIEYCLDKLNELEVMTHDTEEKKGNGDSNDKRIKIKIKKIIAIAAIIAVFLVGTLSASALVFEVNLFDGIVELYNDYIRINFDQTDDNYESYDLSGTEIAKELAKNGFDEILLPETLLSGEYAITSVEYERVEFISSTNIKFKFKDKLGSIYISKYDMEEIVPYVEFLNVTSEIEKIEIDNITVFCFMQNKEASINYRDGLYLYTIQIPLELNDAVEFAKTIK